MRTEALTVVIGRHPPRAVDAVHPSDAPPGAVDGGSAASVLAGPRPGAARRPRLAISAKGLYNVALGAVGVGAVTAMMRGQLVAGVLAFLVLFALVRFARLGD